MTNREEANANYIVAAISVIVAIVAAYMTNEPRALLMFSPFTIAAVLLGLMWHTTKE